MQDYEYKDEGGRFLCRLHDKLRCDECHYVSDLRDENKRYREAREIIEQVYKENYVKDAYGYEDGYLDGLDTAMSIIDKALEELE